MAVRFLQSAAGLAAKLKQFANYCEIGIDKDDAQLKFKDTGGVVRTVLTENGTQTLSGKSLSSPIITGAPSSALNKGAAAGAGITEVSDVCGDGILHHTVLAIGAAGANDIDLAGDADNSKGKKLYTFPEGRIVILGAMIESEITVNDAFNANPNDVFEAGVGSADATQAANGALAGTEQDIVAKQTLDTAGNTDLDLDFDGVNAASVILDGRTTPAEIWLNLAVLDASTSKAVTAAVVGALKFSWFVLGDD